MSVDADNSCVSGSSANNNLDMVQTHATSPVEVSSAMTTSQVFQRLSEQYAKVRELELAFDEGARRLHASNDPGMTRMCGNSLKNLERCHRLLTEELDRIFDEYESLSNISRTGKTEMNEHRLLNSGATEAREEGATGKLNCADNEDRREEEITQFGEPS